ncbi:MAG: replication protein [Nitrospirota bacterium]
MAREYNPDKFTMIENKIIENAFSRLNLTGRQWRVLWVIIRHTLGYGVFSAMLTYRQISRETAIDVRNTHETVHGLLDMNIIQSARTKLKTRKINFIINMDYNSWKVDFHKSVLQKVIEANLQRLFNELCQS